jgi:excisionase family DNA binding protein
VPMISTSNRVERQLLCTKEVAAIYGIAPQRVRQLVASGQLRSIRLDGTGWHRFRPEDVERLMAGENDDP